MAKRSLERQVRDALTLKLMKLQACCLDDGNDFEQIVAAVTETTLALIRLDRRSRM